MWSLVDYSSAMLVDDPPISRIHEEYISPFRADIETVIAPEDKDLNAIYRMSRRGYQIRCVTAIERDEVYMLNKKSSARRIARRYTRLWKAAVPKRHTPGKWGKTRAPYMYMNPKGKCIKSARRVCKKPGHSCERRIVSWAASPPGWKKACRTWSRFIECSMRRYDLGWELWLFKDNQEVVRSRWKGVLPPHPIIDYYVDKASKKI